MLLGIQKERIDFIKELKKFKRIFMLSNINLIHEEYAKNYLELNQIYGFYELFEKVYFSHQIGFRKPHQESFHHVCSNHQLDIKKTLFIDDSAQHIKGASEYGLQTYLLDPPNTFIKKMH